MNSKIRSQPVTTGPSVRRMIGFKIKNPIIACLYHTGELPRKFRASACDNVFVIDCSSYARTASIFLIILLCVFFARVRLTVEVGKQKYKVLPWKMFLKFYTAF